MIVGAAVITMLKTFVLFPAEFVALALKLNVPIAVGVPEIAPVVAFRFKPLGSVPLAIDQVIGIVPVTPSIWLYDWPTIPPGRVRVVIIGISVITILKLLVVFPEELVALIVKLNVPSTVGVPEIAPVAPFIFKPVGSVPLAIDQVIGVVPVAFSV